MVFNTLQFSTVVRINTFIPTLKIVQRYSNQNNEKLIFVCDYLFVPLLCLSSANRVVIVLQIHYLKSISESRSEDENYCALLILLIGIAGQMQARIWLA